MKSNAKDFITSKPVLIIALVLIMFIPLAFIKSLVVDREYYKNQAVTNISQPMGYSPKIEGIVVAMPYWQETKNEIYNNGTKSIETTRTKQYLIQAPIVYDIDAEVNPFMLNRGIFKIPAFYGKINITAKFSPVDLKQFSLKESDFIKNECIVLLGTGNSKTLKTLPQIKADGTTLVQSEVKYSELQEFSSNLYYILTEDFFNKDMVLTTTLNIQGTEKIRFIPFANENNIRLSSTWKSPSFTGDWLPESREISAAGFSANWKIPGLSTTFTHAWHADKLVSFPNADSIVTTFLIPVDFYQKTSRSVKYGFLFLMVPFISLFLSELFLKQNIHPLQYCLIGIADVLFYLLLLSISEHLGFFASYFISAGAVCFATWFYTSGIFKSIKWGSLLSVIQLISYIFLFGTLQAEDYALLIGSIGLFLVVLVLMTLTRKTDILNNNLFE